MKKLVLYLGYFILAVLVGAYFIVSGLLAAVLSLPFLLGGKQFYISFLLFLYSSFLLLYLYPIGFLYNHLKRGFVSDYYYRLALSNDQLGNAVLYELLDDLFLKDKEKTYGFGDEDETISSALGRQYKEGNLTKVGLLLVEILNIFDRNHVIKSIEK